MELPVNYNSLTYSERREVRERYVKKQKGNCYYCGAPLSEEPTNEAKNKPILKGLFPINFFKYPVHLHHNHDTGITMGAVHSHCNAVLWQYHGE